MTGSPILAIDGPGGAGKSSVATRVAEVLGIGKLDTGALYRAVTAAVLYEEVDPDDGDAAAEVAKRVQISFSPAGRVFVDDRDVTDTIRGAEVTREVSIVSSHPGVRRALVEHQRRTAKSGSWVVEGRDIGTVVFPDAPLKVFLTAASAERARRRGVEIGETDLAAVESDIVRRDGLDATRSESPLRPADDAVILDTTDLSLDDVVERIVTLWRQR